VTTAPDGGPDNRTPDRDRQLVDLAADVRKSRGEIAKLRNTLVDLASTISEWGPQLVDTQKDVAKLSGQVEELLESPEIKNAPVDWFALPAEDAAREWVKLGEWVQEVLGDWYLITRAQLPDCWALHCPAFLQLAWLRSSHIEAYLSRSHPAQAAEWNVRWLDAALDKIKDYIPDSRCRAVAGGPGEHLVDKLQAEQGSRVRGQEQTQPQAADLRQHAAAGPSTSGNPYPNPYAQQQPQRPVAPPATPAHPTAPGSAAGQEVIRRDYWGGYFNQAMQADLMWRRERESRQAAETAAAEQAGETAP